MITYSHKNILKIKVLLDGRIIGKIKPTEHGWAYWPKNSKNHGEIFKNIQLVKNSLEADN